MEVAQDIPDNKLPSKKRVKDKENQEIVDVNPAKDITVKDTQTLSTPSTSASGSRYTSEAKLEKAFSVLRNFPSSFDLFVPTGISYDRIDTFLLMYKTHCHRIIDAIICSEFDDVQVYLNHFWSEIPEHLHCLLEMEFLSRVIELCDMLFYEALEIVLLPSNVEDISDHVVSTLEIMAENFPLWINYAIRSLPQLVCSTKLKGKKLPHLFPALTCTFRFLTALDEFVKSIRRQLSLIPLIKSCTLILSQTSSLRKMISDLKKIDFSGMNEDINLLIDSECLNEIKGILALFLKESEAVLESSSSSSKSMGISMSNLVSHVKDSMNRTVRNTVRLYQLNFVNRFDNESSFHFY